MWLHALTRHLCVSLHVAGPDMDSLIQGLENEQAANENKKQAVEDMAAREWNRDFGHCFPDLLTGIHKEVAALRNTRDSDEDLGTDDEGDERECMRCRISDMYDV